MGAQLFLPDFCLAKDLVKRFLKDTKRVNKAG